MRLPFTHLKSTRKLENAIIFSILVFLFKLIFPAFTNFAYLLINELLVIGTLYFWLLYVVDFVHVKANTPLSITLNAGILNALLFFVISISTALFTDTTGEELSTNFFYLLIVTLVIIVFITASSYILSTFRELFLLRQKKDPKTYFNVMLFFMFVASLSKAITQFDNSLEFIFNTFYVVSIILISINSLRVAWIAFLQKNQKIYLLIIAIILGTLFGLNFALLFSANFISSLLNDFSPALETFISLIMIYGAIYFGVIFFTTLFHLPTAEAFDRKAEEVTSLMDLTKLITRVFDFKELAETITTITTRVCASDAAWLVTIKNGSYNLNAVNNIGYLEADQITGSLNLADYENVDSVQTINQSYFKIKIKNDTRKINYKSVAIAPLKIHSITSGFLFTARKQDYAFDEDDIKAIGAFADYASVALENAKLIQESIEKERLEKELDVAREIQYKILPARTPEVRNLEISALFVPAFEVGGDYYDFFTLSDSKLAFAVADVSGKGISASFIMAEVKGIFETLATLIDNPKELLIKANEVLKSTLERKNFVTAIYGIIDIEKGKLTFARVGHTPIHHFSKGKINRLSPPGIGLGLDYGDKFNSTIKEMEIELKNNDILLLYTDGIVESQNSELENFGYDRLDNILLKNSGKDVHQISNEIMREVSLFSRENSQHDDITLVLFNWVFNNKVVGDN